METLKLSQFKKYLKPRPHDCHKGQFGHVLIIGGDYGFSGSLRLAAEAALRVGAGRVSVATRKEHALVLNNSRPEIMCHDVRTTKKLELLLTQATVIIIGPGMGQSDWAKKLLDKTLQVKKPLIVDADGLNLLAKKPRKNPQWILTPHPKEAARLLKTSVDAIQRERVEAVKELQKKFNGVCVLKGAGTLILASDNHLVQCTAGNPGMATAGMGDVLSGVIAGWIAQQVPLPDAAKLGVLVHALAGDLAAKEGQRGMLASDLMPYLRKVAN